MNTENIDVVKLAHAAQLARADMEFAMNFPCIASGEHGRWRLEQSQRLITEALGDESEFKNDKERWAREKQNA